MKPSILATPTLVISFLTALLARKVTYSLFQAFKFDVRQKYVNVFSLLINRYLVTRLSPNGKGSSHAIEFEPTNPKEVLARNHTHRNLAAFRNAASINLTRYAKQQNKPRYDVSTSRRENCPGNHSYYDIKDLLLEPRNNAIPENAIITFVDCDYYHQDLNAYAGHDLAFYTFTPQKLAGFNKDSYYSFDSTNTLTMRVKGGAKYTHKIWDFDRDVITLQRKLKTYVYRVDRIPYGENHHMVFLTLKTVVFNPCEILHRVMGWTSQQLNRSTVEETKSFLYRVVFKPAPTLQIMQKGSGYCIEIPTETFCSLRSKYFVTKKLDLGEIKSQWQAANGKNLDFRNSVFQTLQNVIVSGELADAKLLDKHINFSNCTQEERPSYGMTESDLSENSTMAMQDIMEPVIPNANTNFLNNEAAEITAHEKRVASNRNTTEFTSECKAFAAEFKQHLIGDRKGCPHGYTETLSKQTRPAQKARNQRIQNILVQPDRKEIFLKAEAMGIDSDKTNIKAPRVIVTYKPTQCLDLSAYTYSFKNHIMKRTHWYASCWEPKRIETELTKFLMRNTDYTIAETDQSKFDAHISEACRDFEKDIYATYFSAYPEFSEIYEKDRSQGVNGKTNLKYKTGSERHSGSALTTDGNGIINAFISYVSHRMNGESKNKAWKLLGPKSGDDSLDYGNISIFEKGAAILGFSITGKEIKDRNHSVSFLGRNYILGPGGINSICDVPRMLAKLHLVANKNVTKLEGFGNKVYGYETTDPNTPIISNLASLARRLGCKEGNDKNDPEYSRKLKLGPYTNNLSEETCVTMIAGLMNKSEDEIIEACRHIDRTTSLAKLSPIFPGITTKIVIPGIKKRNESAGTRRKPKSNCDKSMKAKLTIKAKVNTNRNGKNTKQKNVYKTSCKPQACDDPKTTLNGTEQGDGLDPAPAREC